MALAHQILESVHWPAVTNARANGDGGLDVASLPLTGLLAATAGLGWSKDNLRTADRCYVDGLFPNGVRASSILCRRSRTCLKAASCCCPDRDVAVRFVQQRRGYVRRVQDAGAADDARHTLPRTRTNSAPTFRSLSCP